MGTLARNSLKTFRRYIQHKGLSFYDLLLNFLFLLEDYQGNWKYVESNNKPLKQILQIQSYHLRHLKDIFSVAMEKLLINQY